VSFDVTVGFNVFCCGLVLLFLVFLLAVWMAVKRR